MILIQLQKFYKILFFWAILSYPALEAHEILNNYSHIEKLINRFNYGITVLEVADHYADIYSLDLAKKRNDCAFIVLFLNSGNPQIIKKIKEANLTNIVVLEPYDLNIQTMDALVKCEHFDISIVHDYFEHFKNFWDLFTELALKLGTYVFFEIDYANVSSIFTYKKANINMIENQFKKVLFLSETVKNSLEIARITQVNKPESYNLGYEIKANFYEKSLFKKSTNMTSNWIPGINLLTFVMLYGTYPTDDVIREELKKIPDKFPYHNDLIIGNIIINGIKLTPIDFLDERRNANMSKMLNRAISFFNGNKDRLKNPAKKVNYYYKNSKKNSNKK